MGVARGWPARLGKGGVGWVSGLAVQHVSGLVYNTSGDEREGKGGVGAQCACVHIGVGTGMWLQHCTGPLTEESSLVHLGLYQPNW